ncbi:MAG: MFS transporter [Oscillospiraceae bacterium]|jgi:Na+/melibiose symporter-like transporter|nr:MFS transporter [Oscillospiraceae bacterium]
MHEKKGKLAHTGRMLSYAAGYMLGGGSQQITSMYYMNFLMFAVGLPPLLAGLVTGVSKVWDGVIDPVLGLLVDRTKTRLGACRPWLLASALPVLITYYMLWNSFGIASLAGKFVYFLVVCILFSTASSLGIVPYEALLPRMVGSYDERTDYSVLKALFAGMASAGSIWLFEAMIPAKQATDYAGLLPNFRRMGFVLGLVFAAAPLVTFFGSRERPKFLVAAPLRLSGVFGQYRDLLRSRVYRRALLLNLLGMFVSYCSSSTAVIFVLLVYSNLRFRVPLLGTTTLVLLSINWEGAWEIMGFFMSTLLMKRYSKHTPLRLSFPLHILGSLMLVFVTAKTPLWFFFAAMIVSGFGASCIQFIPSTLMPDLPDVDELISGQQREGSMAGLLNLGRQIVQGLSFLVCGAALSAFGLNEQNATPELAQGGPLAAVKLLYAIIPVLCGIAMWLVSRRYPLTPERHALIQEKIAKKREFGKVELSQEEQAALEAVTGLPCHSLWVNS